jgi:hypothetical protein
MIVWFPVSGLAAQERASDRPDEPEPATVFARHGTDRIWLSGQVNDGGLTYGREQIVEAYYTVHFWRGLFASADLQHIANPGRIAVPYWSSARVCISISSDRRPRCSAPSNNHIDSLCTTATPFTPASRTHDNGDRPRRFRAGCRSPVPFLTADCVRTCATDHRAQLRTTRSRWVFHRSVARPTEGG